MACKENLERFHFLLITFPAQGQINPALELAERLTKLGTKVTYSTSLSAISRMNKSSDSLPEGLNIVHFSDGFDNGSLWGPNGIEDFLSSLSTHGSRAMAELIMAKEREGDPITHVFYTPIMSWVGQVANQLGIPSTLFWVQPATVLAIYHYYFNGYGENMAKSKSCDPLELPGLPLLTSRDLPSFLLDTCPETHKFAVSGMKAHIDLLEKEENPKILVNTYDELEFETLRAIKKYKMMAIGPLISLAFLDGRDSSNTSFSGDLVEIEKTRDYVEWLNSKPDGSVVYVSFGSQIDLPQEQIDEIAEGLIESQKPFLWVIRTSTVADNLKEKICFKDEMEKQGMIIPWCSQLEVLSHHSVGCFVTHCGWNSTLESLAFGVPVLAIPQWTDQITNAKLIQDIWSTGIRAAAKEGAVEADEIKKTLEIIMDGGKKSEEMKRNAKRWSNLAREAAKGGGSSSINLKAFLDEIGGGATKAIRNA